MTASPLSRLHVPATSGVYQDVQKGFEIQGFFFFKAKRTSYSNSSQTPTTVGTFLDTPKSFSRHLGAGQIRTDVRCDTPWGNTQLLELMKLLNDQYLQGRLTTLTIALASLSLKCAHIVKHPPQSTQLV